MARMFRAVLFDIGGVLATTPTTRWQERWEARLGRAAGAIDAALAGVYRAGTIGAVTEADVARTVAAEISAEHAVAILDDLWDEYLGQTNRALLAYFAALRPRYRTGILSNSWVGAREREQARHGFADRCDTIVYSHEEGMTKPDPRFYELACARLGVRPSEVLFLDDIRGHVEAARGLGMTGIVFVDAGEALAELRRLLGSSERVAGGTFTLCCRPKSMIGSSACSGGYRCSSCRSSSCRRSWAPHGSAARRYV